MYKESTSMMVFCIYMLLATHISNHVMMIFPHVSKIVLPDKSG